MRISALGSKEIQAVIIAMDGMDRALAKQIRAATQKAVKPIWQESVRGNLSGNRLEARVLGATATTQVRDNNVVLKAGASSKRLSGGASISELVHSAEFGADRSFRRGYESRSSKGRNFSVKNRATRAQFRPRKLTGYAVYPAAADAIPRLAALWVATSVRTFYEILEGA